MAVGPTPSMKSVLISSIVPVATMSRAAGSSLSASVMVSSAQALDDASTVDERKLSIISSADWASTWPTVTASASPS